jgi:hypothetical protein
MQAISGFLKTHSVQLRSVKVPDRDDADWPRDGASHYVCILTHQDRHMLVYYSMGAAYREPPSCRDVLDCLASDAASLESSRDFADWCSEFGYSEDSRKARRIFKTCRCQARQLKRLLGEEAYAALLFETERL